MKIIAYNFNNILTDVIEELKKRGHDVQQDGDLKDWKSADVIVLWQEIDNGGWRKNIEEVQKLGVKVVLVQHGRRGSSRMFPPFNEKLVSDVFCVWGENDKKRFISCGIPEDKIKVTGTTLFKHLKQREKHEGKNVIFSPEHWDTEVIENDIVKGQLEKMKGVNIISKLIEGEHNPALYPNPIVSDRHSENHLEICADVLKTADVIVGISESTFELMAEILDIPVVIANIWIPKPCNGDDRYLYYHREYSDACTKVKNPYNLSYSILQSLNKPKLLREERKQIAIGDGGIDIANPLKEICDVIENI